MRAKLSACLGVLFGLAGCSSPPVEVPVEDIAFPVVLIYGTAPTSKLPCTADMVPNREDLSRMRLGIYLELADRSVSEPPVVIDAAARSYRMENISGERGTLWMMMNPNGMMPIRFKLMLGKEGGIGHARRLIGDCQFLGREMDQDRREARRAAIREADSMARILEVLN